MSEDSNDFVDLTADDRPFYYNQYSGELSLDFPKAERRCRGGILAYVAICWLTGLATDQLVGTVCIQITCCFQDTHATVSAMGMGKTIMVSSLIHTNSAPEVAQPELQHQAKKKAVAGQLKLDMAFASGAAAAARAKNRGAYATLVVAPTSLLDQWGKELERSSCTGTIKVTVWHGSNRADIDAIARRAAKAGEDDPIEVVVTSYGVLASEHGRMTSKYTPPIFAGMFAL